MLLVIDVGNTNLTVGVFRAGSLTDRPRLPTIRNAAPDFYGPKLARLAQTAGGGIEELEAVVVASVVPALRNALDAAVRGWLHQEPFWISADTNTGIRIPADRRGGLGVDRLVDMAAAHHLYTGPVLVMDFGTATTYDVVTETGVYLGGAIAPGIKTCAAALSEKAEQLPMVDLRLPDSILGQTTEACIQSGILFGAIGQTEYFASQVRRMVGRDLSVVATGGLSALLNGHTDAIDFYDEDLTLKGLHYLYRRNRSGLSNL